MAPGSGIGFGAERLGLAVLRAPRLALAAVLAILVLIGIALPQVRFDADIHRVFLSDSPLSQAQRRYDATLDPPGTEVIALIRSDMPFSPADLGVLRDLSLDLEFTTGVAAVASPFLLRMPPADGAPDGTPVFPVTLDDGVPDRVAAFRALDTGLPTFLNGDGSAMLIGIRIDLSQADLSEALAAVRTTLAAVPPGLSVSLTGEEAISVEIVGGLKQDLIRLNVWGVALVTLAALLLLRDVRMVVLSVVPAVAGAAAVLALSVWLGRPVTVLSNVIPILLLVLGVADGVHLSRHLAAQGSVAETLRRITPACALTALTTAAAFASILVTRNAQLHDFAILGAVGTLLAFGLSQAVFTLLARGLAPARVRPSPLADRIALGLARFGMAQPRRTAAGAAALLAAGLAGYATLTPWFPLHQNLPDDSPTIAANDFIAAQFGGVFRMIVEVEGNWDKVVAVHTALTERAGPEAVLSEVGLARWLGAADAAPTDGDLDRVPGALRDRLRSGAGSHRIFVLMPEPMRDRATADRFDALFAAAMDSGAERVLGLPTVMRIEAVRLITHLSIALTLAALGATAIVALAFRSLRLIPVLLIPNLLPLMLTGATLHLWAQGALTPPAVLALTLAFGIAIDDTVHFLHRFAEAQAHGADARQAILSATATAGQVMVLTTLLLSVGLCITLISSFPPIRLFGGMLITTLWAALLVDLLLLPALLSRKDTPRATR